MLHAEEGERQAAVSGIAAVLLTVPHIKHCLVQVKVSSYKIGGDLILVTKDEVVESCNSKF